MMLYSPSKICKIAVVWRVEPSCKLENFSMPILQVVLLTDLLNVLRDSSTKTMQTACANKHCYQRIHNLY